MHLLSIQACVFKMSNVLDNKYREKKRTQAEGFIIKLSVSLEFFLRIFKSNINYNVL